MATAEPKSQEIVSFGAMCRRLAEAEPAAPAIIFARRDGAERVVTRRELDRRSNQVARLLARRGAGEGSFVFVGLANCPEHYIVTLAIWKLGACVLPISPHLPARERDGLIEVGQPSVVVGDWDDLPTEPVRCQTVIDSVDLDDSPLPDKIPHPGKAIGSGGSTGRPKIIVDPSPWAREPGFWANNRAFPVDFAMGQVQLVPGALHHNMPFGWGHMGLFHAHTIVLMEKFDAAQAVDLIEKHHVQFMTLVPTMMNRIAKLPDIKSRDLSSVQSIVHSAAMCPPWVKQAWIDLIGPEKVFEGYGASEAIGHTTIRGDEWLKKPGSVGKPAVDTLVKIFDEQGREAPPGEVGLVYFKRLSPDPTYYYVGSKPAPTTDDGFATVGDLGWLDADGYLFPADRRVDMIISGGANIYPAEIEAVLSEHPDVFDVAVIGLPDDDWGRRVHAVIHAKDPANPPTSAALDAYCRANLSSYKAPKSYEFVDALPRDEAGKIRRSAMVTAREAELAALR